MKFGARFLALFSFICGSASGIPCGETLTQSQGEFFSPGYPNNYPNYANCTWSLLAGELQVVSLNFTFVDLESGWDFIRVYDGPTAQHSLLGSVTGNQRATFNSSSRYMTVVFSSDVSVTQKGFQAKWAFIGGVPCGGTLTQSRGEFFSPSYPNNYPNYANCTWSLLAGELQVVSLNFTFVDLESCCDFIRVYDGPTAQHSLLGSVTGNQRATFNSSSRYMTVVFSTDRSVTRQGFQAEWTFIGGVPCGRDLTQSRGEFFSPNYPNDYPNDVHCVWRLQSPSWQIVSLNFTFVKLEMDWDFITVYDGPTDQGPPLGIVTGNQGNSFSSSSRYMTVVFHSDSSWTENGFRAEWRFLDSSQTGQTEGLKTTSDEAPCGGNLTQSQGEFFSPNFPHNYPNNAKCTWRLQGPEQQVVSLTFTFVDLESTWDSVHVYDGPTNEDPQLGAVTANQTKSFNSSSRYMTVVFSTDRSMTQQGFRAEWTFIGGAPCGGTLTQSRGEFFSPSYPNNYPNYANCTWSLLAGELQVVSLKFTFVNLESCCDFIRVYDGLTAQHSRLGSVTGNQRATFNSSSRYMTVVFSTDGSVTGQGFRAEWTFIDSPSCRYNCGNNLSVCSCTSDCQDNRSCCYDYNEYCSTTVPETTTPSSGGAPCGGTLTQSRGEFFSPSYPNNYPNYANCTWSLLAGELQVVSLNFTSVNLESCCDFIRVYDGLNAQHSRLGSVTGNQRATFNSSSRYMTVVFSTDGSVTGQGFRAEWTFIDSPSCRYNCGNNLSVCSCTSDCQDNRSCCYDYNEYCSTTVPETTTPSSGGAPCGGTLTQSRGEFFSPSYPNNYPNYANCTWSLLAGELQVVSLNFTSVNLESCCDFIRVYDGLNAQHSRLGSVTGNQRATFNSSSRYMTVVFSTDGSVTGQGFRAEWTFIDSPSCRYNCGNNLSVCSCTSDCQDNRSCCYDYNEYCSTTVPETTTPSSGGAPCGGTLTQSRGEFFSPSYPNNYPNYANCTWSLLAGELQVVSLNFTSVNLESCCDFIRVYDGLNAQHSRLGSVTGNQRATFNSSSRYMTVVFSTDGSVTGQGFRAEWTFIDSPSCRYNCGNNLSVCSCTSDCQDNRSCCYDYNEYCSTTVPETTTPSSGDVPCGGTLTQSRGEFFSPNYPNDYPNYAHCTWSLLAGELQVVSLNFTFVNLESCCDFIRVYDGLTAQHSPLVSVTGNQRATFNSSSRYMTVVFSSDSSVTGQGFRAEWTFIDGPPCGGDLTQTQGEFFSPNFPNAYPNDTNCIWRLLSPEQQVVSLTIVSVDIEFCPDCGCDAVYVYDGPSSSSPLLGTVCGHGRKTFSSSRNTLTVVFSSDSSINGIGFVAHWNTVLCGGILTQSRGEFFSPSYPNNYPNYANCTWSLLAGELQVVLLNFTFIDLESCCDFIRVYDGPTAQHSLLGSVTGNQSATFNSTSRYMTVVFSSDFSRTRQGFRAEWTFIDGPPCGGDLTQTQGEFFSPNFPDEYPEDTNCIWRLLSPEQQVVSLTFVSVDIEFCPDCGCDAVYVYDGPSSSSPLLGTVCGHGRKTFSSSRNTLTVVFSSDSSFDGRGFIAHWNFTDSPSCRYNCGNNLSVCSCTSDCQDNRNCCYDNNEYCSTTVPETTPPSSDSGTTTGTWESTEYCTDRDDLEGGVVCGEDLTQSKGEFFSPNYPNSYPEAECTWRLLASEQQLVMLNFTFVNVKWWLDLIHVYDGPSDEYPLLDILTGNRRNAFNSSGRYMTVTFSSYESMVYKGFHAEWNFLENPSCRCNCGYNLSVCSCTSDCRDNRNCCYDYDDYCSSSTTTPVYCFTTTGAETTTPTESGTTEETTTTTTTEKETTAEETTPVSGTTEELTTEKTTAETTPDTETTKTTPRKETDTTTTTTKKKDEDKNNEKDLQPSQGTFSFTLPILPFLLLLPLLPISPFASLVSALSLLLIFTVPFFNRTPTLPTPTLALTPPIKTTPLMITWSMERTNPETQKPDTDPTQLPQTAGIRETTADTNQTQTPQTETGTWETTAGGVLMLKLFLVFYQTAKMYNSSC
ncbi:cubilin isoform X2 [Ictalurus punctatus]|uniref:Cubilin isoform X2 n=1 Tax=Ictalurus punctatus TaxID=7998 RepID=A0A9F7RAD2_ICTPU|nr:cubilin isoform X2 [Ictalurus punctatus]